MFLVLSIKALTLDFLIGDLHFHDNMSDDKVDLFKFMIIELLGFLKTFRRQNIALTSEKL